MKQNQKSKSPAYSVERIAYSQNLSASAIRHGGSAKNFGGKRYPLNAKTFWLLICCLVFCIFNFTFHCFAEEITILYTGETHAMLYPCNCPKEPDGGVARRATLIKQLKKDNPDTLVLDSGGFFSGGLQDEYTQNTALDMQRALLNLKAMELMQYDALTIGDDEFNFGREFLEENIVQTNLSFLSCNISEPGRKPALFRPYIIKEVAGKKIGIIGVTTLLAMQKSSGLKFIEPGLAVKEAVSELKKSNTDIIILLSHLGESEDLNLIKDIEGIDILIVGHSRIKEDLFTKINNTLFLRPAWQGRRLGKLTITLKDHKITNYKIEELRLSDKVTDDPDTLSILPRCFSDNDCRQDGHIGICQGSGTLKSQCEFSEASKVNLLIITTKLCNVCNTEGMTKYLKAAFPGLVVSYLYYPENPANKLISDFGLKALPVFLLGKEAEREKGFDKLKENLEIKGDFYMLKAQFSGIAYYLKRKSIKGRLDLFISLYDKNTPALLDMLKEFSPTVHFLALEKNKDNFEAQGGGNLEVEEDLRSVCVQKYYPANFWDYISCRGKFINTSWWQDCLDKLDTDKISICARGEEGKELLRRNISLNNELQIIFGPVYLSDNQEIFASQGVPTKEEFRKTIKR